MSTPYTKCTKVSPRANLSSFSKSCPVVVLGPCKRCSRVPPTYSQSAGIKFDVQDKYLAQHQKQNLQEDATVALSLGGSKRLFGQKSQTQLRLSSAFWSATRSRRLFGQMRQTQLRACPAVWIASRSVSLFGFMRQTQRRQPCTNTKCN